MRSGALGRDGRGRAKDGDCGEARPDEGLRCGGGAGPGRFQRAGPLRGGGLGHAAREGREGWQGGGKKSGRLRRAWKPRSAAARVLSRVSSSALATATRPRRRWCPRRASAGAARATREELWLGCRGQARGAKAGKGGGLLPGAESTRCELAACHVHEAASLGPRRSGRVSLGI